MNSTRLLKISSKLPTNIFLIYDFPPEVLENERNVLKINVSESQTQRPNTTQTVKTVPAPPQSSAATSQKPVQKPQQIQPQPTVKFPQMRNSNSAGNASTTSQQMNNQHQQEINKVATPQRKYLGMGTSQIINARTVQVAPLRTSIPPKMTVAGNNYQTVEKTNEISQLKKIPTNSNQYIGKIFAHFNFFPFFQHHYFCPKSSRIT